MMGSSPTPIAPLLLRNLITSIFFYADKPLCFLAQRSKLLEAVRYILISSFLFFLRILPSLFPSLNLTSEERDLNLPLKTQRIENYASYAAAAGGGVCVGGSGGGAAGAAGSSGIARALSQLLYIVNDIPVSSRKYDVVRSLAERIIDENLQEGNEALREVNCIVLSAAFGKTLSQLESAMLDQGRSRGWEFMSGAAAASDADHYYSMSRFVGAVRYCFDAVVLRGKKSRDELRGLGGGSSAEKLAAELVWLAQKMAGCGCAEEAVNKWASASSLAWLSVTTEPRLQGSIVKISAFLIKQAKEMGRERDEESTKEQHRQTKLRMLLLWMPLLCRASTGTDSPVLSVSERAELERILEEIIEALKQQEDQERVLSLWLHDFTHCPSSDWPNLHGCYTRWCTAARRNLL